MRGEQNTLKGKLRAREQYSKRNADSKREHRYDSRKRERAQQEPPSRTCCERREHVLGVGDLAKGRDERRDHRDKHDGGRARDEDLRLPATGGRNQRPTHWRSQSCCASI